MPCAAACIPCASIPLPRTFPLVIIFAYRFPPVRNVPQGFNNLQHGVAVISETIPIERRVRVLVAESSRMHTRLLADALRHDPLLEVIAYESDSAALVRTVRTERIDVLVLSSNVDEQPLHGLELLPVLRTEHLQTRTVLLLGSSKEELILRAFRAGARGLFTKNDSLESLSECVRSVHQGRVWANAHALSIAVDALASSPAVRTSNANCMNLLSKRELEVVWALAEGLTNREIAEQLKLSPHTIKNYLFRIFDKLGVSSRIELLFMALSQPDLGDAQKSGIGMGNISTSGQSPNESALLEKSAEAGLPAAQMALAQLHFARRRDPTDLVQAYMWYLVATERALLARGLITKLLTPEQIEEAKQKASVRLSRLQRSSSDPLNAASPPALSN